MIEEIESMTVKGPSISLGFSYLVGDDCVTQVVPSTYYTEIIINGKPTNWHRKFSIESWNKLIEKLQR